MAIRTRAAINRYVAEVCILGCIAASWTLARGTVSEIGAITPAITVLVVLVVIGELYPIRVTLRADSEDVTTSTAFMVAVLLLSGPALAVLSQVAASVVSDIRTRKAWWKAAFNAAQYTLAIVAAFAAASVIAPDLHPGEALTFAPRNIVAALVAGGVFFVLNNIFVIAAVSIYQHVPVLRELRSNLGFHAATTLVLIAQAPIIAVAASHSILWVLLFVPGILAVYRTAQMSQAKEQLASHDVLTGLPNRLLFRDRLARLLTPGEESKVLVMIVDLDNFKEVNDTLGHHIGDSLLNQVGQRLQSELDGNMVARLGGDEFAIVGTAVDRAAADELGRRVLAILQRPFALQELPFHIEASVGGALHPEHGTDVDTLLQRADVAMYLAKEEGTGFEIYAASRDRYSPRRLALLGDLRRAIEQGELVLQYQPIADMRTGKVSRAEALVRWNHPEHGLLPPADFIPLAEPTGLMGPLTQHILDLAISQCRIWRDDGLDIAVAVNISARNLQYCDLTNDVQSMLEKWSVPPHGVELEITESAVMSDPRRAAEVVRALDAMGIQTSLDDFGTGYSSLAYLKRLPVHTLKIDRSFVVNMATDDEDSAIVTSIIDLARSLGLATIAEGVESADVWRQLQHFGCDAAQGYYLSRPLPAEQFSCWVKRRHAEARAEEHAGVG